MNSNTKQARKKNFSSMYDLNNNGHKTVKGVCVDSTDYNRPRHKPRYGKRATS